MTETEWRVCGDPKKWVKFLQANASERQLRLIACAYCRRFCEHFTDPRCRTAVEVGERYANQQATAAELLQAFQDVSGLEAQIFGLLFQADRTGYSSDRAHAAHWAACAANPNVAAWLQYARSGDGLSELATYAGLIREVLGNPFRPLVFDPSWRTPTVVAVARFIDERRAFDQLPVLADALAEAGCEAPELIDHCRQPADHVPGCWTIDAVRSHAHAAGTTPS